MKATRIWVSSEDQRATRFIVENLPTAKSRVSLTNDNYSVLDIADESLAERMIQLFNKNKIDFNYERFEIDLGATNVSNHKKSDCQETERLKAFNYFGDEVSKILNGNMIGRFSFSYDRMSGVFYWSKYSSEFQVVATPYWEIKNKIPVAIIDGDDVHELLPDIDFNESELTYDPKIDARNYLVKMLPILLNY